MPRPDLSRVPHFFHGYINKVIEDDLLMALSNQSSAMFDFFAALPASKQDYAYADGKWTIKELLQHMLDTERVFAYRALVFARNDKSNLPGFDENAWADASLAASRNWDDVIAEFKAVRKATEYLFASFNSGQLDASGFSSNNPNYVLAVGFTCVGHCQHHLELIKSRYL